MAETSARLVVAVVTGVNEYQTRLLRGVRPVLAEHDLPLVVHANDPFSPGIPASLVRLLQKARPRGVIMTNCLAGEEEEEEMAELLDELGIAVVYIGVTRPDATCIHADNVSGMRLLVQHVVDERGARRPALIRGIPHQSDSTQREQVFREELARRGITLDERLVVNGDFSHDVTYAAMRELLRRQRDMDAVVALNDLSALGALGALTDEGIAVPEGVIVSGFDNEQVSSLNWPGLTTVDQDLEGQGEQAASFLIEDIVARERGGGGIPPRGDVPVPSQLVVRGSTAPRGRPATDELDTAIDMARAAQSQLAAQDAVVGMNRAMIRCRTLDQVVDALASRLDRLGVGRCYLAVYERAGSEVFPAGSNERARLILAYREGATQPLPDEVFPSSQLLPEGMLRELDDGLLVLQPLSVLDRELGFVLFEQERGPVTLTEVLRMDLSRTLDAVFSTQELEDHAATLERLVARRTRELESEVVTRRRAERELQRANAELQRSLMLDGLTRIANRVAFARHLEQQWQAQAKEGAELALLMVDVDLFKAYNDRYGHLLGDETLRTVANCLERAVRDPEDLACRYGGEEFAVVLPHSGIQGAVAVAVRFRGLLAEAAIPHAASPVAPIVTASVGIAVAVASTEVNPASVVEAADKALYRAKALGRDRVAVAGRGDPAAGRILSGAELTSLTGEGNGVEDTGARIAAQADR